MPVFMASIPLCFFYSIFMLFDIYMELIWNDRLGNVNFNGENELEETENGRKQNTLRLDLNKLVINQGFSSWAYEISSFAIFSSFVAFYKTQEFCCFSAFSYKGILLVSKVPIKNQLFDYNLTNEGLQGLSYVESHISLLHYFLFPSLKRFYNLSPFPTSFATPAHYPTYFVSPPPFSFLSLLLQAASSQENSSQVAMCQLLGWAIPSYTVQHLLISM